MTINENLSNRANYGSTRLLGNIKYIVIHYTAGDGDTDENNAKYFHNNKVGASAHYFVDDDSITRSVPDGYVAWSVGGNKYPSCSYTGGGKYYGKCTNANSISIELCDCVKDGKYSTTEGTIKNAVWLVKKLMKDYNIPVENVIRHFDVTGKLCPAYWSGSSALDEKWQNEFIKRIKATDYFVRVKRSTLNVFAEPKAGALKVAKIKQNEVYTIIEESANGKWGRLKSGKGWIRLKYTDKV